MSDPKSNIYLLGNRQENITRQNMLYVVEDLQRLFGVLTSQGLLAAGTYGSATQTLQIVVGQDGVIQSITPLDITGLDQVKVNSSDANAQYLEDKLTAGTNITLTVNTDGITGNKSIEISAASSGGSVTTVSVVTANGFAGTVANATTTPAITMSTTINGVLKGDGTAISAATDADITGKLLTGYVSGAGTVSATDSILTAIEKLNGNASLLINGFSSTGVISGGVGSVNGGTGIGTTVDITAGSGVIFDNSTPSSPTYTYVSWGSSTGVALVNTGVQYTYWYYDSAGVLQQTTTAPTRSTYRTRIWLFRTSYTGGVITGIAEIEVPIQQVAPAMKDLNSAMGAIRVSGAAPTYSGANLKLKITAGEIYDFGTNWPISPTDPNIRAYPTYDTAGTDTFRYGTTSGTILSDVTNLDFANYQVGGVVTAIPGASTRVTIQYVFGFQGGLVRVTYGIAYYTNVNEALVALAGTDPYASAPSAYNPNNSFVLGAIIAPKNATTLNTQGTYVVTNKFGYFGGGALAAGGGAFMLTDFSNASTANPISTGGTNSSAALSNNRVMKSSGGAIVEAAAITASRALISDANGIPTQSTTTSTELGYVSGVTSVIQTQLDAKLVKANNLSDVASTYTSRQNLGVYGLMDAYNDLGAAYKGITVGCDLSRITVGNLTPNNQDLYWIGIIIPEGKTITGVWWYQGVAGNYTANNNNRLGLCTFSGGNLSLVASCTNDANLWQTASVNTFGTKAFSSTYAATAGLYFITFLYCRSAAVSAPAFGATTASVNAATFTPDNITSRLWARKTGQTDLQSGTQAMSGLVGTGVNSLPVMGVY